MLDESPDRANAFEKEMMRLSKEFDESEMPEYKDDITGNESIHSIKE